MSQIYGEAGEPRTIVIPVDGEQSASYMLPPGIAQYVQAVLVNVDNSGGPDARPTLRISEQSGVVIAAKRQGEAIPSGDTGTATWALRLTDEAAASPAGAGDYVLLDSIVITVGDDPIVFSGISQSYKHLYVEVLAKGNSGGDFWDMGVQWNGISAAHYGYAGQWFYYPGTTPGDIGGAGKTAVFLFEAVPGDHDAKDFSVVRLEFPYYAVSGAVKSVRWSSTGPQREVDNSIHFFTQVGGGSLDFTADAGDPITSITLFLDGSGWGVGARASLYGAR